MRRGDFCIWRRGVAGRFQRLLRLFKARLRTATAHVIVFYSHQRGAALGKLRIVGGKRPAPQPQVRCDKRRRACRRDEEYVFGSYFHCVAIFRTMIYNATGCVSVQCRPLKREGGIFGKIRVMNDNKASYARIGFVLFAAAIAIVCTLVYLGGAGNRKEELLAETYSKNPVSGLSVGSEVNFRGVKVGEVREITFVGRVYDRVSEEDAQMILIVLAFNTKMRRAGTSAENIEEDLRLRVDQGLRATVTASGITGLARIELDYPKRQLPPERLSWLPRRITIPPAPSMLESISEGATHVINQINSIDIKSVWSNVTELTQSAATLTARANELIESSSSALGNILNEVEGVSANLRSLIEDLKEDPSLLLRGREDSPLPETE